MKKSRASYFKERRKNTKTFYAEIDIEKMKKFEDKLKTDNQTKNKWLNKKIDEELKNSNR